MKMTSFADTPTLAWNLKPAFASSCTFFASCDTGMKSASMVSVLPSCDTFVACPQIASIEYVLCWHRIGTALSSRHFRPASSMPTG